jgi:hypothetical protein
MMNFVEWSHFAHWIMGALLLAFNLIVAGIIGFAFMHHLVMLLNRIRVSKRAAMEAPE